MSVVRMKGYPLAELKTRPFPSLPQPRSTFHPFFDANQLLSFYINMARINSKNTESPRTTQSKRMIYDDPSQPAHSPTPHSKRTKHSHTQQPIAETPTNSSQFTVLEAEPTIPPGSAKYIQDCRKGCTGSEERRDRLRS
jgi:hypothetical protein